MNQTPIAKIVSGYSGDPDTREDRVVQVTGSIKTLPIGTRLYAVSEPDEMVLISADEYNALLTTQQFMHALDACGVDNWEGYERAQEMVEEWDDEGE